MLLREEQRGRAIVLAIGADALEHGRAVVEGVGRDANARLGHRHQLPLEVRPCAERRAGAVEVGRGRLGGRHATSPVASRARACAAWDDARSSRRSGRASRCQMAYSSESCSAASEAEMMFASAPAVSQVPVS